MWGGEEKQLSECVTSVPFRIARGAPAVCCVSLSVPLCLGVIVLYYLFGFALIFLGSPICFEFSLNYKSNL